MTDYMTLQTMNDGVFGFGRRNYIKSGMVETITPELLRTLHETFPEDPHIIFGTHTAGGAVARVDELATAFPHRNTETLLVVISGWENAENDQKTIANVREWWSQLEPHTGGYYQNLIDDADNTAVGNYGPVYARLAEVKKQYDPTNLFRLNSNIRPAA